MVFGAQPSESPHARVSAHFPLRIPQMQRNAEKYPADKSRGKSDKYTAYTGVEGSTSTTAPAASKSRGRGRGAAAVTATATATETATATDDDGSASTAVVNRDAPAAAGSGATAGEEGAPLLGITAKEVALWVLVLGVLFLVGGQFVVSSVAAAIGYVRL